MTNSRRIRAREIDDVLIEQLDILLLSACAFANAKAPGYERITSSPPSKRRSGARARCSSRGGGVVADPDQSGRPDQN